MQPEQAEQARTRYVLVGGKAYPEALMIEAMNQATTEYLDRAVAQGSTPRAIVHVVRGMKTAGAHRTVMNMVLRAMAESGLGTDPAGLLAADGEIVARFPVVFPRVIDKQVTST